MALHGCARVARVVTVFTLFALVVGAGITIVVLAGSAIGNTDWPGWGKGIMHFFSASATSLTAIGFIYVILRVSGVCAQRNPTACVLCGCCRSQ